MTHDPHDLIDRLFQQVAPYLEDAFDAALYAGPTDRTSEHTMARVRRLQSAAKGLASIAVAIEAILPLPAADGPQRRTGLRP